MAVSDGVQFLLLSLGFGSLSEAEVYQGKSGGYARGLCHTLRLVSNRGGERCSRGNTVAQFRLRDSA